tara:strand:+ start:554 stop:823 length:270 start_codon:yes stop_codon:yes gene_type:complete
MRRYRFRRPAINAIPIVGQHFAHAGGQRFEDVSTTASALIAVIYAFVVGAFGLFVIRCHYAAALAVQTSHVDGSDGVTMASQSVQMVNI